MTAPFAGGRRLVLDHLDGRPVDRLPAMPITMLFAARLAGVPYRRYCTDYRELARAQTLVAERFGFDHVSVISDPTREAGDLGAAIAWFDDQPPAFDERDATEQRLRHLSLGARGLGDERRQERDGLAAKLLFSGFLTAESGRILVLEATSSSLIALATDLVEHLLIAAGCLEIATVITS